MSERIGVGGVGGGEKTGVGITSTKAPSTTFSLSPRSSSRSISRGASPPTQARASEASITSTSIPIISSKAANGLPTSSKVAIGVAAPLGMLALLAIGICFFRKRRSRTNDTSHYNPNHVSENWSVPQDLRSPQYREPGNYFTEERQPQYQEPARKFAEDKKIHHQTPYRYFTELPAGTVETEISGKPLTEIGGRSL